MQKNWIGRSEGVEITFNIENSNETVSVYTTTRPDTFYGVSYMAVAAGHPLAEYAKSNPDLAKFIQVPKILKLLKQSWQLWRKRHANGY